MLLGHSWGAYSAGSVLNLHPDISAVVMLSGFDKSVDMIKEEGKRQVGSIVNVLTPYISLVEKIKFGQYASYSCTSGFEASKSNVMIVQSTDDKMVSFENQFSKFNDKYKENPRFKFIKYTNKGHDYIFCSDSAKDYCKEFDKEFSNYVTAVNTEMTVEIKKEYMEEHFDKKLAFDLDTEFMNDIVSFYDNSIKN